MSDVTPQSIVAEARSWLGTPYRHQACVKGVGCDCLGMVRGVWCAITCNPMPPVPTYTPDWNGPGTRETLHAGASAYLQEIQVLHVPRTEQLALLQDGDVVLFRMVAKKAAKHCGIVATKNGERTLIHAYDQKSVKASMVSEITLDQGWMNRLAFAFRFEEVV